MDSGCCHLDVSQIVYIAGALLEMAQLGRGLVQNCDSELVM